MAELNLGIPGLEARESVNALNVIEAAIKREVEDVGDVVWGLIVARSAEDRNALA